MITRRGGGRLASLESIRAFVRVVELGSITAGAPDQRLMPVVASNRIRDLESRLRVRLLNRTTRKLTLTKIGRVFYEHTRAVIDSGEDAEAAVAGFSGRPRGALRVTALLDVGGRIVAPLIPLFVDAYPEVEVRLRLSDRWVDIFEDQLDVAFFIGRLPDSALKLRRIAECNRVLCAAPDYLVSRSYLARRACRGCRRTCSTGTTAAALSPFAGILLDAHDAGGTAQARGLRPLRYR